MRDRKAYGGLRGWGARGGEYCSEGHEWRCPFQFTLVLVNSGDGFLQGVHQSNVLVPPTFLETKLLALCLTATPGSPPVSPTNQTRAQSRIQNKFTTHQHRHVSTNTIQDELLFYRSPCNHFLNHGHPVPGIGTCIITVMVVYITHSYPRQQLAMGLGSHSKVVKTVQHIRTMHSPTQAHTHTRVCAHSVTHT